MEDSSQHKRLRKAYLKDSNSQHRLDKSVEHLSAIDKSCKIQAFMLLKRISITNELLLPYFEPMTSTKRTTCFKLLELIFVTYYRNKSYYGKLMNCDSTITTPALSQLLNLGYVSIVPRPRKIAVFNNAIVMTKTYVITPKGRRVIRDVYELVGLI